MNAVTSNAHLLQDKPALASPNWRSVATED
jgi:hypothetical protein